MELGRPLGIHAATVVRTYHGITCIKQGLHDGSEVGSALAVIAEPGTTIDMNHDRIGSSLFLRQINVTGVIRLVVTGIVDILPLLTGFEFCLLLEATKSTEASSWLSFATNSQQTATNS